MQFANWLDKRIPAAHLQSLDHRKIFIMPSKFGFSFIALCALVFVLGTNYQNNIMRLLCTFLLALFVVNLMQSYRHFAQLILKSSQPKPLFLGQSGVLPLHVDSHQNNAEGQVLFSWWKGSFAEHSVADINQFPLDSGIPFTPTARGEARLPRVTLSSYYPLGLYRCWTHLDFKRTAVVYPAPLKCSIHLYDSQGDPLDSVHQKSGGHEEFDALREFQDTDALSNVAWKQAARHPQWMVKTFTEPDSSSGWVTWQSSAQKDVELHLSELAFHVISLSDQGASYGLRIPNCTLPIASGEKHRRDCLYALAIYPKPVNPRSDVAP